MIELIVYLAYIAVWLLPIGAVSFLVVGLLGRYHGIDMFTDEDD